MLHPFPLTALLFMVVAEQGCTTDPYRTARFTLDAAQSRCGVPTVKQLTTLPALPPVPSSESGSRGGVMALSHVSYRMAQLLGLYDALHGLTAGKAEEEDKPAWSVLWRHQQIADRIALASFDVISTVTEIDCEVARADSVADGLAEIRQDKQERGLFLALVGDALIGVVAGSLSLAGKATAAAANAILGGALATGVGGAATIFLGGSYEFQHPRNHLEEVWEGREHSPLFPDSVWRYLTSAREELEGSIREELIARWQREHRFGEVGSEVERRRKALLLGAGGTYEIRDLRVRAEMLSHLKSEVLRMEQDLNVLMYEIMSHSSYTALLIHQ